MNARTVGAGATERATLGRNAPAPAALAAVVIGIDPGVQTGFAAWNPLTRALVSVQSVGILRAMREVEQWRASLATVGERPFVIFEDARKRRVFTKMDREQARYGAAVREGVGSVKRDCSIWEEFLTELGVPFKGRTPIATKWKAEQFERLTKWQGRTNEHARDAAMIVYGLNVPMINTMVKDFELRRGQP